MNILNMYTFVTGKMSLSEIVLNPEYQRDVVWTSDDKSSFIESVLCGLAPSILIFNKSSNGNLTCIDGKQRITAICDFIMNKFYINIKENNIESKVYFNKITVPDDKCRILSSEERNHFTSKSMFYQEYNNLTYEDQVDLFLRVQKGKPLSSGELLQSFMPLDLKQSMGIIEEKYKNSFKKFISSERKTHFDFHCKLFYIIHNELKFNDKKIKSYLQQAHGLGYKNNVTKLGQFYNKYMPIINNENISHKLRKNIFIIILYGLYKNDKHVKNPSHKNIILFINGFIRHMEKEIKKNHELKLKTNTTVEQL